MDRRTLITLFLVLLACSGFAGETGERLAVRGASETYYFSLYEYELDVRTATEPALVVRIDGRSRFCRLIASGTATASEPVRVRTESTFVNDTFAIAASSPYSVDYTDEGYFTYGVDPWTPNDCKITAYNGLFGPTDVIIPPLLGTDPQRPVTLIEGSAFENDPITSVTWGDRPMCLATRCFANTNLTSVTIPANATTSDYDSYGQFAGCASLTTLIINAEWAKIPDSFAVDSPLTNLYISKNPDTSVMMGSHCFTAATRVTFEGVFEDYSNYAYVDSFASSLNLSIAHSAGGAGTYSLSGTTWTKE